MRTAFKNGLTGRHVLGFNLAFYAVILAVTGTFTTLAVRTHPGGETAAYQRGLRYNETLAEAARQDRLNWTVSARHEAGPGRLQVSVLDRDGRPLRGQRLQAVVGRPATDGFDRLVSLSEEADGSYAAPLALDAGTWTVDLRVNLDGTGERYKERIRLWVQPRS